LKFFILSLSFQRHLKHDFRRLGTVIGTSLQIFISAAIYSGRCQVTQPQQLINVLIRSLIFIASRKVSLSI